MAGTFMSTLMMFFPENTQWFCAAGLAIFVFCIYIPYQERKKKKKQAGKGASKEREKTKQTDAAVDRERIDRLKALRKAGILSEEEYQEKKRGIR